MNIKFALNHSGWQKKPGANFIVFKIFFFWVEKIVLFIHVYAIHAIYAEKSIHNIVF
jgi:hypothetical protein